MRLKHIKLAGFKSFVDPTKVPFEHQMTSIVGPNGCGKSNIIDAVRWVLGESSAKNLRGDAMTDVIFNGASTRKPVGQASVELVFDNMIGRLEGSMADRNEVSIRRVVNRDSQNTYFLNGTKCRRKDITDIFLGTGLGPRSYAIIEQGTISRLIESKPQELRVFIEEAAGISKYKERRRDTENRIRHTRENLERLTDIRIELGEQIEHLYHQAEAAKRFKTLKTQERKYKAELAALRWQKFNELCQALAEKKQQVEQDIQAVEQTLKDHGIGLFTAKQKLASANENLQQLQSEKLQLSQKLAAAEQRIKHYKQQQLRIGQEHSVIQQQLLNAQESLILEQEKLELHAENLQQHQPELLELVGQLGDKQSMLKELTSQQQTCQQAWQNYHREREEKNEAHIAKQQKIQQLETTLTQLEKQVADNTQQLAQLSQVEESSEFERELALKMAQQYQHDEQQQVLHQQISEQSDKLSQLKVNHGQLLGQLSALDKNIQQLVARQNDKSKWQQKQQQWLSENNNYLHELKDNVEVSEGWELATELVLGELLEASIVPEIPQQALLDNLRLVFANDAQPTDITPVVSGSLAEQVKNDSAICHYLNDIFVAESLEQAKEKLKDLALHQSVICQDGTWLGHSFLIKGKISSEDGFFQQSQRLNQLQEEQELLLAECDNMSLQTVEVEEQLQTNKSTLNHHQQQVNLLQSQLTELEKQLALQAQRIESTNKQKERLITENDQLVIELEANQEQLKLLLQHKDNTEITAPDTHIGKQLEVENQALIEEISIVQQAVSQLQQDKHQTELLIEQAKHQHQYCQQNVVRLKENITQLNEQVQSNQLQLEETTAPLLEDEEQSQQWLASLAEIETQISEINTSVANEQQKVDQLEANQTDKITAVNQYKEVLTQIQLDSEAAKLRAETANEQLIEQGQNYQSVKAQMPNNARESQWQAHLARLAKDIQVLGAINLAAIEEYEVKLTRKNYLDQQDQDLNEAISTLESAIAKIDKESRQKFKVTFEQINNDLQMLFPKVFGGGQAYLELTGEDLLETGVTIMARPPGKKNSTIHLLSGGEKALTALSLVFAIFRLNPAPFCMLDEVDAPLDDANVGRFCNLVKEMSQTVQFIYISHNKIAMEMANHLTGVTMFEAGVSRMVAVDIDEAIAMADVS